MEERFRFREEDERMDYFAKREHYGNDFYYAGLFYSYQMEYMENIAKYFYKHRERKKEVMQEFEKFLLENKPISGKAEYLIKEITGWRKPWDILKGTRVGSFPRFREDSKFNIYELKLEGSSEVDKKSGLIFLAVEGYEDQSLSSELEWNIRKLLMEEWKRLSESEYVKKHIEEAYEVYNILEEALPEKYYQGYPRRFAYYLFPIKFDTFGNKIIVSTASLYKRREETRANLWLELLEDMEKDYKEDLNYVLEERGKDLNYLKNLLDRSLSDEHLRLLREDWKKFLKKCLMGGSNKLRTAFVGKVPEKDPPEVSFGIYKIPDVKFKLMVFAENGFNIDGQSKEEVVSSLKEKLENFRFLGNVKIVLEDEVRPLEGLFGGKEFFEIIKGKKEEDKENGKRKNERKLKPQDSLKLINALSYFTSRMSNLIREIREGRFKGEVLGILLLLNTEFEENERYLFWNFVSFIYDHFGIPVQTLTKRSLRAILKERDSRKITGVIKNLVISLYKDSKILEIEFKGFHLPEKLIVYAIVEKPSTKFFYRRNQMDGGARHYLYEVYKITIEKGKAQIELESKVFELQGMRELGIEKFIREHKDNKNVKFCLITALKDSKLNKFYESFSEDNKFLLVRYAELKTAYFSEKTEQHCFIVYTQEMAKLAKSLGIQMDKDVAAIALKPAHAKGFEDEMYHPALQLFFTEKVGWERDEVYSEKKSLFIFTVLALSMYESESYNTPFSKLDIWTKEQNYYLTIRRFNMEYTFPLTPVLYEMLYFVQERPGKKEFS